MKGLTYFLFLFASSVASAEGKSFTYEDLAGLITSRKIEKLESLLPLLPKEHLSNYTLMRRSRSAQPASPALPRVILYGDDASLIMAYSGDEKMNPDAYQRLEVIQYRASQRKFEFREITFANGKTHFSEPNPAICLLCHRQDPRPNWEQYNEWPGAYGEVDDSLSASETRDLEKFFAGAHRNPRYSPLINLIEGYKPDAGERTQMNHNIVFTQRIFQLNFMRIARLIQATPEYEKYKYLIALSLGCTSSGVKRRHFDRALPDSIRAILGPLPEEVYHRFGSYDIALFRHIFEARGAQTRDWLTSFIPDKESSFLTPASGSSEMLGHFVEADPELKPFIPVYVGEYRGARTPEGRPSEWDCGVLAAKSFKSLSK